MDKNYLKEYLKILSKKTTVYLCNKCAKKYSNEHNLIRPIMIKSGKCDVYGKITWVSSYEKNK